MDKPTTAITSTTSKRDIATVQNELDENLRKQELIQQTFVYFEKCPVRYVVTRDDKGNELKGTKYKNRSTPEEHFNTLNKLTATQDILLHGDIVDSAVSAQPASQKIDRSINVVNQVLADFEPKDSFEAKLSLQAHTLYTQGMQHLSKADNSGMLQQKEFYMKSALKLLRLHNETVEALSKYRRGGTQNVIVQHVQVNDGGKAIVGGVFEGGGETINERGNPMIRECGAKARTNNHKPCRRIAMANGKCHLHGGMVPKHNPGPKTEEGRQRQHTSSWKHGMRSKAAIEEARQLREYIRQCKQAI